MSTKVNTNVLITDLTSIFENALGAGYTENEIIEASDKALDKAIENFENANVKIKALNDAAFAFANWLNTMNAENHLSIEEIKEIMNECASAATPKKSEQSKEPNKKTTSYDSFWDYLNSIGY